MRQMVLELNASDDRGIDVVRYTNCYPTRPDAFAYSYMK